MIKLSDFDLLVFQTAYMKSDATTKALCVALNDQYKVVVENIEKTLIYPILDNLPEEVIDELAWQFHVDWYDMQAPIETKIELVKTSRLVHSRLGTVYAVEEVAKAYMGDATIEEWFNYGGEPYYFNVLTSNPSLTGEVLKKMIDIINKVKNVRSWLDKIIVDLSVSSNIYIGAVIQIGEFIDLEVN